MSLARHPAALAALSLPAWLFGLALRARERYYDRNGAVSRAPVPVISVGNLTVGGTGKTPFVGWLAQTLLQAGRRPAVVSRGYGGRAGAGPVMVSIGDGPMCGPEISGDEPFLLARRLAGVPIVVGSNRLRGAQAAAAAGADVVLLDDGFQHRRLARDLDIVLLDATNPFGNYRLLPAGRLREPIRALGRADLLVITRSRGHESFPLIEKVVRVHNPHAPIVRAGHRALGFLDASDRPAPQPRRAVAFCAIGNPGAFRIDLEALGVDVVSFEARRDHRPHQAAEISRLRDLARGHDALLVTTEKDLARMPAALVELAGPALVTLCIEPEIHDPEPLLGAVFAALDRTAR